VKRSVNVETAEGVGSDAGIFFVLVAFVQPLNGLSS